LMDDGAPEKFVHLHAAHCESGVTAALVRHAGLSISEPMVFGIGSGIFFGHVPWLKVAGIPLTTFRALPGSIFVKTCRRLGIPYRRMRWLSADRGMAHLDRLLAECRPVGLQVNIFWLDYFPPQFRSQFNAHNLIAVERVGAEYAISDPLLEAPVRCTSERLRRARFAKGPLAPRGLLYYPGGIPAHPDIERAVWAGIRETCHRMLRIPVRVFGVSGIRFLSRRLVEWPGRLGGADLARIWLGNVVRMQEEVGTGGAGFRYLYAAFLQEAGHLTGRDDLGRLSETMTAAGDQWREFAVEVARICRNGSDSASDFARAADALIECARLEEALFNALGKMEGRLWLR